MKNYSEPFDLFGKWLDMAKEKEQEREISKFFEKNK